MAKVRVKVEEFVPEFLALAELKESTRTDYTRGLRKCVLPLIGKKWLDQVVTGDCESAQ